MVDSSFVSYLVGGIALIFSTGLSVYFSQRDRRSDKRQERQQSDSASRTSDAKIALNAWMSLNAANTAQIASLTTRLDAITGRLDGYEKVIVPQLEATIASQQQHITELLGQITAQQTTIAALTERIARLEHEKVIDD